MLPNFLYGTAWKEHDTERLTLLALQSGFRGIDTANQRRHYYEKGVGDAIEKSGIGREELFIQTKFTYASSQDHRIPYDPKASVQTQVLESFASSLEHLGLDTIDSFLLHGPSRRHGLAAIDRDAWRTMEELQREGKARHIGISNVALDQLEELWQFAEVKPSFVQNRCFARARWDADVRRFCVEHGIVYQGFSLLTANVVEIESRAFREIVARTGRTSAQVVFRFAQQVGMLPITGTTDPAHMRQDLASREFDLTDDDLRVIENIAA